MTRRFVVDGYVATLELDHDTSWPSVVSRLILFCQEV